MLNGPLGGKILMFALPLAVTGMLQQLFNAADVAVIGRFVGKDAMAAVGSNSAIIGLLVNLFVGISLGTNVVISRYTGQHNKSGIRRAVHTSILVALISGVVLTVIGELMAGPILRLMGVPDQILPLSTLYLRVYFTGMPVILLYNFESAIFRSQGDTRTPLICLFISGIINVALNILFVVVFNRSVDGVAAATVISNVVSSGLLFIILLKSKTDIRVRFEAFGIDVNILKNILRIGVPAGIQGCVFSISNIIVQSAVNSLGATVMAASAAAFNLEIMVYFVVNSFGQAATTFTGQNYGAGKLDRCRKSLRLALLQDLIVTGVISIVMVSFAHVFLGFFNKDPDVIYYGTIRMRFIITAECLNVLIEIFSGAMRGYGASMVPAIVAFAGICGVRITWVLTIFRRWHTIAALMAAYPASWFVTSMILIAAYFIYLRKYIIPVFQTDSGGEDQ